MSKRGTPMQKTAEPGFWRLEHDHLTALLARRDLSWETARVYLAVADLTRGWGKERDVVSLSQIADQAGMFTEGQDGTRARDYRHVSRALRFLHERGLYGQAPGHGQAVIRWVAWPPPPLSDDRTPASPGTPAKAGSGTTARVGSGTPAKTPAKAGRHQDVQDIRERKKAASAAALSSQKVEEDLKQKIVETGLTIADLKRLGGYAFRAGRPSALQRETFLGAVLQAISRGATGALIANFQVRARPADAIWDPVNAAGKEAVVVLKAGHECFGKDVSTLPDVARELRNVERIARQEGWTGRNPEISQPDLEWWENIRALRRKHLGTIRKSVGWPEGGE